MPWDHIAYCDAVEEEIARCADAARAAGMDASVPTCPGWTVADLVTHVGTIHRWAGQMVRDGATERLERRDVDLALPDDTTRLADWLAEGAVALTGALREADPDREMWAWGADQHARFWSRRMLHETAIHRVDAALAGDDARAADVDAGVAADGIDELLENLPSAVYFAPVVAGLRGAGEVLALRADGETGWDVRLRAEGFEWQRSVGGTDATVTVHGTASDLYRLLWRRRAATDDAIRVTGDREVLDRWLTNSAL